MKNLFGRAGYAALIAVALIASVVSLGVAANITVSTGAHFVPTGPALTKGSDLNVLVDKINTLNNGTITGDPVLIGNAVNKTSITSGATGVGPRITVGGTTADTNMGIVMLGKGTGNACLGGATCAAAALQAVTTASAVDFVRITGAATASPATVTVLGTGTDSDVNVAVTPKGAGVVKVGGAIAACSGTTTATCQGQRFVVSITGLTTAPVGVTSAAMVVTNASVVSSSSMVVCQVNGYGGTGVPIASTVTPGTGSLSLTITNVAGSGSLNATVPVACFVFGT